MLATVGPFAHSMPFIRSIFLDGLDVARVDVERLRQDPQAAVLLFTMQAAIVNRLSGMRRMRSETMHLREVLEAEPALR